jgi:hypothetical protein
MFSYCIAFLQRLFSKKQTAPIVTSSVLITNPATEPLVEPLVEPVNIAPESVLEPFREIRPEGYRIEQPEVQSEHVEEQCINPRDDPLYYADPSISTNRKEHLEPLQNDHAVEAVSREPVVLEEPTALSRTIITPVAEAEEAVPEALDETTYMIDKMD